jgi:hypothetical protein
MNLISTSIILEGSLTGTDDTVITLRETLFSDLSIHKLDAEKKTEEIKNVIKKMKKVNGIYIFIKKDSQRLRTIGFYFKYNDDIEVWEEMEQKDIIKKNKLYNTLKKILDECFTTMLYEYTEELRKEKVQEVV